MQHNSGWGEKYQVRVRNFFPAHRKVEIQMTGNAKVKVNRAVDDARVTALQHMMTHRPLPKTLQTKREWKPGRCQTR